MSALFELNFALHDDEGVDENFAFAAWPGVPRRGDFVTLRPAGEPKTYRVELVLWGTRYRRRRDEDLSVDVHIREEVAAL